MSGYQPPDWKDINRIELRGRLGRDPESRTTQGGMRIISLTIATGEKWTDRASGEKKEKTQWHRVNIVFNDAAADHAETMRKGQRVRCVGKMEYREWTDNTGAKRTSAEVVVDRFGEFDAAPDDRQPQPQPAREAPQGRGGPVDDGDQIPFSACKE